MTKILVYTTCNENIAKLLEYSSLYDLEMQYCFRPVQVLGAYSQFKPELFLVQCNDSAITELRFVKALSSSLPVFALTSNTDENVAVKLLDEGADYLVHLPCGERELYYQLRNFIRLTIKSSQSSDVLHLGELQILLRSNQVQLNGEFIPLTAKEFKLLLVLANNLNKIVSVEQLYREVYHKSEVSCTSRALNMHISNLRHKLQLEEFAALRLETKRGKGFGLFYAQQSSAHGGKANE